MKAQDLKNSILQLAIQGKLVEQREEEGTAKELIEQIKAEKEKLIKEKKLKKQKALPIIKEDEIPFEIPENWEWVRLEQVCEYIQRGKSPKYSEFKKYPVVAQKCNQWSGFSLEKAKFIDPKTIESYTQDRILQDGDLMWNSTGLGTLGRVAIYEDNKNPYELAVADSHVTVIRPLKQYVDFKYIYYYIANPSVQSVIEKQSSGSTKQIELATNTVKNYICPLPPLEEQKRIVTKIEELLPYVEKYDKAYTEVEELNKKFPEDMQKSILQYAIQGKLVEQREEEGTAEELYQQIQVEKEKLIKEKKIEKIKALPEITEDEISFDIPENWKWVRLGNLISISSGKGLTSKQMLDGNVPVFGGNGITGYHNIGNVNKETVVIGRVGYYCGSVHITPAKAWITDNAFITIYPENHIDRSYLVYILRHLNLGRDNNATAQPVVSGKKIYTILFPLPPLAEQKRIVAKIEEMLPYTKQLIKKID